MQDRKISLIGLGAMGQRVARRLMNAGGFVSGYDLSSDALAEFTCSGGHAGKSVGEAIADTRLTLLFVVNRRQAESVLFAENGIADNAKADHLVLSCVTMSSQDARSLAARCAEHDLVFVDAPVSGGTAGAKEGTLSVMASGPDAALETCMPLFSVMGQRILKVGQQAGQGSAFKTINQMLCGVHLAVAGEALALAERAGLDTQQVFDLVSNSAASSWMLNDRGPAMLEGSYQPVNSAVDIFVKDLGVVSDLARELKFPATVSAAALQSFLGASGAGFGLLDDSAVTEFYKLARRFSEES